MLYFYARDTMVKVNIFSSTIVSVYGGQVTVPQEYSKI